MSYPYSDEDSTDSDSGIRFKTTNTRHHISKTSYDNRSKNNERIRPEYHRRNRSRSRERSNKREDRRRSRHRSRTPEKYYDKHRRHKETKSNSEKYRKSQQTSNSKDNLDLRASDKKSKDIASSALISNKANTETVIKDDVEIDQYGPKLPPKKETPSTSQDDDLIGPALPSSIKKSTSLNKQDDDMYGPTLPPVIKKTETQHRPVIGPTLPPHLKASQELLVKDSAEASTAAQELLEESDSDEEIVGPLPAGHSSNNPIFMQLEERALEMKLNGLNKVESDNKVREEWMLELPEVHTANLGLGPRQFRAKGVPDMSDRSSWTDTPQDKLNKASKKQKSSKSDIKKQAELEHLKQRDLEQEQMVEKHKKKKKRDKSLLDIHQEKLNKKKKEESTEKEIRRPFSRDIDLKANRFDEAQKKSILKKAQLLDNRFSSGESKFL